MNQKSTPSKKRGGWIYKAVVAALILANGALIYGNVVLYRTAQEERSASAPLLPSVSDKIREQLKKELTEAEITITQLKKDNAHLSQTLGQYKQEIERLKKAVSRPGMPETWYKEQLAQLEQLNDTYIARISMLEEGQKRLEQEKAQLQTALRQAQQQNQHASRQSTSVTRLKTEDIVSLALRRKSNGKFAITSSANKADRLYICFDVAENELAQPAMEELLVRIVTPEGSTLFLEQMGSGTFPVANSNEMRLFSLSTAIEYDASRQRVCLYWEQTHRLNPGQYSVEIYNKGHLIGKTTTRLL